MEQLVIHGGHKLKGDCPVQSAKNSVLPIIACCILSEEQIVIHNCPKISDIYAMLDIITSIGGIAAFDGDALIIDCKNANPKLVAANLTGGIRSSIFILGPILGRFRTADISYPGGCEIGLRPIDLHLMGLRALSVAITEESGMIICDGAGLKGGVINLDFPSVGATENIMMAAVLAKGTTVIRNAAREPEIADLQNFINYLGGKVRGAGSDTITVEGVPGLGGGEYTPICDRIAAGTYLAACAMCGGDVRVSNIAPEYLYAVTEKLARCGCDIDETESSVRIRSAARLKALHKIETQPYPGFPTDMQAQFTAMLSLAAGSSMMVENLFESRFKYTAQLVKMGANITVKDRVALIRGVKGLSGSVVKAEDLRGGAALVMAGMAASGETTVTDIHHIDRGYPRIETVLNSLGGDVVRRQG